MQIVMLISSFDDLGHNGLKVNLAAVAWEAGMPLIIEEVDVAPPKKMEVRIRIHFTSLCHSDVYFWEAKGHQPLFPRILGHEAGGVIESVEDGVTALKPGEKVLPLFIGECGECRHCKSSESNLCDLLRINLDRGVMLSDGKPRFSKDGKPIYHFVGTFTSVITLLFTLAVLQRSTWKLRLIKCVFLDVVYPHAQKCLSYHEWVRP
ncbi:alcohol dehydrogenase 1-like [Apium graveolens]|uniref:alcohol dehydrogenase 1-like n=1 Tax=Apium graveolens TaxID=4045 RepID=UPI003D795E5A